MSHINRGDVHAYLDGALGDYSQEAAEHVREHLDACSECARLLENEKRLREQASAILAASAVGPVELDPLEDLLARAAKPHGSDQPDGREQADGAGRADRAEGPDRTGRAGPSLISRMYVLRWAATVVVSLGAGWLARDLSGPARDVAREAGAESVASEVIVRPSADQISSERDNVGQPTEVEAGPESQGAAAMAEAESPTVSTGPLADVFADVETPPEPAGAVDSRLAEAVAAPESRGARAAEEVAVDSDAAAARVADAVVLDPVDALSARQRAQSNVAPGAGPAAANVTGQPAQRRLERAAVSDELRDAPAVSLPDDDAQFGNLAQGPPAASLSTTPFLVPGLPVRDVRLSTDADRAAGGEAASVVVIQELEDGRLVELEFIPLAEEDAVIGGAFRERSDLLGRTRPAGWSVVVRNVAGGTAVLSGPLTEAELSELLDLALGPR